MAKEGFAGQWIDICRVGKIKCSEGVERDLNAEFLRQVIANYNAGQHEAPIVIGHPDDDAPAFGWTTEIRLNGDVLEARFSDTADEFEAAVRAGLYKKRSAAFYLNPPNLKHVGFLGAVPPAVKGLKNIQFAEGESITFENSFNLNQETKMDDKDVEKVTNSVFDKIKDFFKQPEVKPLNLAEGKQPEAQVASFSEEQAKALITEALKPVEANFAEKLAAKDTLIETLTKQMNSVTSTGKRAEIVAFCEKQGLAKVTPAMKRVGIIEFMESLETADAKETDKAVACFSENADGTKAEIKFSRREWFQNFVENLPPFIQFGEQFGGLNATKDIVTIAADKKDDADADEMSKAMGIKTGGEK